MHAKEDEKSRVTISVVASRWARKGHNRHGSTVASCLRALPTLKILGNANRLGGEGDCSGDDRLSLLCRGWAAPPTASSALTVARLGARDTRGEDMAPLLRRREGGVERTGGAGVGKVISSSAGQAHMSQTDVQGTFRYPQAAHGQRSYNSEMPSAAISSFSPPEQETNNRECKKRH